ncbi:hypothetical protein [Rubritalea tangerina]|uniref:hypothetical protein n=1 Tax=Rubritalea tangerina TaxID=430798 RepID=UPI00360B2299
MQNVIVVIQLSRACVRPSLRLDILQAHSDHSVSINGMREGTRGLVGDGDYDWSRNCLAAWTICRLLGESEWTQAVRYW